jgi:HSP20 family protein
MARFTPFTRDLSSSLQSLQSELNRLFEEYWGPSRVGPSSPPVDLERSAWSPAIDVFETADEILLIADIPGVDPSGIDLSVTGNVLTMRGLKPELEPQNGHAQSRERPSGAFHRQIILSSEVNFEATQAEARNGVLRVRLPKQEAAKPRTIPIHPQ